MHRTLCTAAALAVCAGTASHAAAQENVTIYGIADAAFAYSSNQNGSSNVYVRSGNLAASRIGFRGTEQLAGNLQALFLLEGGYELDTGAQSSSGNLFNRQAYVGLNERRFGSLTLGRQYTPYYLMVGPVGPVSALTGATGAHPGDIDTLDTTVRANNSITYTSPVWNGFQASALWGFGEQQRGQRASGSTASAAVKYENGPVKLALGYQRLKNVTDTPGTRSPDASSSFPVSPVNVGYLSADSVRYIAAAGRYEYGDRWTFGVNATNVAYLPGAGSLFTGSAVFNTLGVLGQYKLTGAWLLGAGYSYTRQSDNNNITSPAHYQQLSLEQTYSLSKRTALYFLEAYQWAGGTTLGPLGITQPVRAVAVVGDSQTGTPSGNEHQGVLMAGIRHTF